MGLGGLEPPTSRLSGVRSGLLSYKPVYLLQASALRSLPTPGGDEENRTPDPLLARQVLSQLSYTPMFEMPDNRCQMTDTGRFSFGKIFFIHYLLPLPLQLLLYWALKIK